ncbi:MAG: alpha/beta hydrolase [Clostridia bacterium]|nr:alpha/beta hydrolase [Clostridia bacterium]
MQEVRKAVIMRFLKIYSKIALDNGLKVNILRKSDVKLSDITSDIDAETELLNISNTPVLAIRPTLRKDSKVMMYLHGGSYVSGPIKLQVDFIKKLAIKTKTTAYIVDYRMAPENTYKEAYEDAMNAYRFIVEKHKTEEIIIIGDSAGGGLTLAFTMYLRKLKQPMPQKLILISPWLDVALTNKEITKLTDDDDYVLSQKGLVEAGVAYAGDKPVKDEMISPLYGDLNGLPITFLLSGTNEILVFDCRLLKKKAEKSDMNLSYHEYEDMFHAFVVAPPVLEEIETATEDIINFINEIVVKGKRIPIVL